jgi:hypothetical protein
MACFILISSATCRSRAWGNIVLRIVLAIGHASLTSCDLDFTFSPDATKQPQASAFWPLLDGTRTQVIHEARKREIDDRMGVDKPGIVQVGVSTENLPTCN